MSERRSRRWTADDLALLRLLADRDEPVIAIAAALTRTVQAIRTKAAQERVPLQDDVPTHGPRRQGSATANDEEGATLPLAVRLAPATTSSCTSGNGRRAIHVSS